MKRYKNIIIILLCTLALYINPTTANADEGMWLIQNINAALEKNMKERGLELSANEIYNADAPGATISDAIVSLGFYCTGSLISDQGLLITNHHCAYGDIHSISTEEHNYLEEGYWAMKSEEEMPIPNKKIYFLKKVIDVTDEVMDIKAKRQARGRHCGFRKICWDLEAKYKNETGFDASLSSMWSGEKYYISLYETYSDLRLVAAPPVCMASFGGDVDNWEWPQHKCDFAIYRVYAGRNGEPKEYSNDNIPLTGKPHLNISTKGYEMGDFTMVIGYPGRTDRYASSSKIKYKEEVELPISNRLSKEYLEILNKWMNIDPSIRLKYSNKYFNISNRQEMNEGKLECFKRFNVVCKKRQEEEGLNKWVMENPEYKHLLNDLDNRYKDVEFVNRNKDYYVQTIFLGSNAGQTLIRMKNCKDDESSKAILKRDWSELDDRVEKDLVIHSIAEYYANVDSTFWGSYQKEIYNHFIKNYPNEIGKNIAIYLWDNSFMSDSVKRANFSGVQEYKNDPLAKFYVDTNIKKYNSTENNLQDNVEIRRLEKDYTHALYRMRQHKGRHQYPNANSTMRISYGQVCELERKDGVLCDYKSTYKGILEKYTPERYEFNLIDSAKAFYDNYNCSLNAKESSKKANKRHVYAPYIDFLTDNDITGGNSGSPVLNGKGELIGLAFDGNKESLASDNYYTENYNKCVCVDIRYVLKVIRDYAHMEHIYEEMMSDAQ